MRVVPLVGELEFLHHLPVERLWGAGPVTCRKLHEQGITKVGEVARVPETRLVEMLGRASGRQLHALAQNRDPRRVRTRARRGSIGSQHALGWGEKTPAELDAVLITIVDRVARRPRAARRVCRTVVVRLRFDDFSRATRSHTLNEATAHTTPILQTARGLFAAATPLIERQGITLLGVALSNLENDDAVQLALPLERRRPWALDATLDALRERFGDRVITRAVLLDRSARPEMPLLPD
jgi:DNA polymerase-4